MHLSCYQIPDIKMSHSNHIHIHQTSVTTSFSRLHHHHHRRRSRCRHHCHTLKRTSQKPIRIKIHSTNFTVLSLLQLQLSLLTVISILHSSLTILCIQSFTLQHFPHNTIVNRFTQGQNQSHFQFTILHAKRNTRPPIEVISSNHDNNDHDDDDDDLWISDKERALKAKQLIMKPAAATADSNVMATTTTKNTKRQSSSKQQSRDNGNGRNIIATKYIDTTTTTTTPMTNDDDDDDNDVIALNTPSPKTQVKNSKSQYYTDEQEELIQLLGGKQQPNERPQSKSQSSTTTPSKKKTKSFPQRREPGFLGDCTLREISLDYQVPICYLADVLCTWGIPPPIDPHHTLLGDLVTGEQAFAILEALHTLDMSSLYDRYSDMDLVTLCYEYDVPLQDGFELAVKEGWNLPFGVKTFLRREQEEVLIRTLVKDY